jgi:hypothetical protein
VPHVSPARGRCVTAFCMLMIPLGCEPLAKEYPDESIAAGGPAALLVDPAWGADEVPVDKIFRITFNKHIDAENLTTRPFRLHSGPIALWYFYYYDPVLYQLVLWSPIAMRKDTAWTLEIDDPLQDIDGNLAILEEVTKFVTGTETENEKPFYTPSFDNDVMPIFREHCIYCHGGPPEKAISRLSLDSKETITQTAINTKAKGRPTWYRITPGRPGLSYLLYKVSDDKNIAGMQMPRSSDMNRSLPLQQSKQETLSNWIVSQTPFF